MLTNSYVGVTEVDADVRDAARGMGMNERQMLRSVELPLASPLHHGRNPHRVRSRSSRPRRCSRTWVAADSGRFIIDGSRISYDDPRVFVGALFVALLSIIGRALPRA